MKTKERCPTCDGNDFKVIERKSKKGGEASRKIECKKCKTRIGPSIIDRHF
jgi:transcriptional regulator NrdR family protein